MAGLAGGSGDWGPSQEALHPRDRSGRWRRKVGIPAALGRALSKIQSAFKEHIFHSNGQAGQWSWNRSKHFEGGDRRRLLFDWDHANEALFQGETDPETDKFIRMMDQHMVDLDEDVIAHKVVPAEAFGFTPQQMGDGRGPGIADLLGAVVADPGYAMTGLGEPLNPNGGPGSVRMAIAVPKGTKVAFMGMDRNDRNMALDRNQNLTITRIEPDGKGGFYMWAVATPPEGAPGSGEQLDTRRRGAGLTPDERAQAMVEPPPAGVSTPERRAGEAPPVGAGGQVTQAPTPAPASTPDAANQPQPTAPTAGGPPPRNEQVVAESIGGNGPEGGAPSTSDIAQRMDQPAPAPAPVVEPEVPQREVPGTLHQEALANVQKRAATKKAHREMRQAIPIAQAMQEMAQLDKQGASNEVKAQHVRGMISDPSMEEMATADQEKLAQELEAVAADFDRGKNNQARAKLASIGNRAGLTERDRAGEVVDFNPETMDPVGDTDPTGQVEVLQPSIVHVDDNGRETVIAKGRVRSAGGETPTVPTEAPAAPEAPVAPVKAAKKAATPKYTPDQERRLIDRAAQWRGQERNDEERRIVSEADKILATRGEQAAPAPVREPRAGRAPMAKKAAAPATPAPAKKAAAPAKKAAPKKLAGDRKPYTHQASNIIRDAEEELANGQDPEQVAEDMREKADALLLHGENLNSDDLINPGRLEHSDEDLRDTALGDSNLIHRMADDLEKEAAPTPAKKTAAKKAPAKATDVIAERDAKKLAVAKARNEKEIAAREKAAERTRVAAEKKAAADAAKEERAAARAAKKATPAAKKAAPAKDLTPEQKAAAEVQARADEAGLPTSVADLRAAAKEQGIRGFSTMRKELLQRALLGEDVSTKPSKLQVVSPERMVGHLERVDSDSAARTLLEKHTLKDLQALADHLEIDRKERKLTTKDKLKNAVLEQVRGAPGTDFEPVSPDEAVSIRDIPVPDGPAGDLLARRLRDVDANDPASLRDESETLEKEADRLRQRGDRVNAALYQEAADRMGMRAQQISGMEEAPKPVKRAPRKAAPKAADPFDAIPVQMRGNRMQGYTGDDEVAVRKALYNYRNSNFLGTTQLLRHPPEGDLTPIQRSGVERVRLIDKAMSASALPEDMEVWRGNKGPGPFGQGPLPADLTGRTWTDPSFLSTTVDEAKGVEFADGGVLMRVRVPKGTKGVRMSRAGKGQEGELLLDRDLEYRVVSDSGPGRPRRIDVEVVGPGLRRPLPGDSTPSPVSAPVKRAPRKAAVPKVKETAAETGTKILAASDEATAREALKGKTAQELKAIADEVKAPYGSSWTKARIESSIVEHGVKRRLDGDAIGRVDLAPAPAKKVTKAAAPSKVQLRSKAQDLDLGTEADARAMDYFQEKLDGKETIFKGNDLGRPLTQREVADDIDDFIDNPQTGLLVQRNGALDNGDMEGATRLQQRADRWRELGDRLRGRTAAKAAPPRPAEQVVQSTARARKAVAPGSLPGARTQAKVTNESRALAFRDAWNDAGIPDEPGRSAGRSMAEIRDRVYKGELSPEEGIRRLETDIDFNKMDLAEAEAVLRDEQLSPEETKDLKDRLARLKVDIAAEEKASKFMRRYFRQEPEITPAEAKAALDPEQKSWLDNASPDEIREGARMEGLGEIKGDTAEEVWNNAVKAVIDREMGNREAAKAKKAAQAAKKSLPKAAPKVDPEAPDRLDVRQIGTGIDFKDEDSKMLDAVQKRLDAGDDPVAIGKGLEGTALSPRAQRNMFTDLADMDVRIRDAREQNMSPVYIRQLENERDRQQLRNADLAAQSVRQEELGRRLQAMKRPAKKAASSAPAATPEAPAKPSKELPPLANGTRRKSMTNVEVGDMVRGASGYKNEYAIPRRVTSVERNGSQIIITREDGTKLSGSPQTAVWLGEASAPAAPAPAPTKARRVGPGGSSFPADMPAEERARRVAQIEKRQAPNPEAEAAKKETAEVQARLLTTAMERVEAARTEAQIREAVKGLTMPELKTVAGKYPLENVGRSKESITKALVDFHTNRANFEVLTRGGHRDNPIEPGRLSSQAKLPNTYEDRTISPVFFHDDGPVGQAMKGLGSDAKLDVGNGDSLENTVGRLATRSARGEISAQQMVDDLRALHGRLPAGPGKAAIGRALGDVDAPKKDPLPLPEGTPAPMVELMEMFSGMPLARQHRRGRDDEPTLMEELQKISQELANGERLRGGPEMALQTRLLNKYHESYEAEGKFELDRAITRAMQQLEEARRETARQRRLTAERGPALQGPAVGRATVPRSSAVRSEGQVRPALKAAQSQAEISRVVGEHLKRITGRPVGVSFRGARPQEARLFGEGILSAQDDFPDVPLRAVTTYGPGGATSGMRWENDPPAKTAFAVTDFMGNGPTAIYMSNHSLDMEELTHRSFEGGWLAAPGLDATAQHEFAHSLWHYLTTGHGRAGTQEHQVVDLIHDHAQRDGQLRPLDLSAPGGRMQAAQFLARQISQYAAQPNRGGYYNVHEIIAEAFAQVRAGLGTPLSKDIYDLLVREYERLRRSSP